MPETSRPIEAIDLLSKILDLAGLQIDEVRNAPRDLLEAWVLANVLEIEAPVIAVAAHDAARRAATRQLAEMGMMDTELTELIDLLGAFLEMSGYGFNDGKWIAGLYSLEVAHA